MQKIIKIMALAFFVIAVTAGCASTKGGGKHACGCTGMIGYK